MHSLLGPLPKIVLLLVICLGTGILVTHTVPQDNLIMGAMYPMGVGVICMLLAPRRYTVLVAAAFFLVTMAALASDRFDLVDLVAIAFIFTASAVVAAELARHGKQDQVRLFLVRDFAWLLASAFGGAVTAGLLAVLMYPETVEIGAASVFMVIFSPFLAHTLVTVPLVAESYSFAGGTEVRDRVGLFVLTIVAVLVLFTAFNQAGWGVLVVPVVVLTALRTTLRQVTWEMLAIFVLITSLSFSDRGPFAIAAYGPSEDTVPATFAITSLTLACACAGIPLALALGNLRRRLARIELERERSDRIIASATRTAIVGVDTEGRVLTFSPGAEQILGYSADEAVGEMLIHYVDQQEVQRIGLRLHAASLEEGLSLLASDADARPLECEFVRPDGERRILSIKFAPLRNEDGVNDGYVLIAIDNTTEVAIKDALESALATKEEAVERFLELEQIKDGFISTVSHELRTPVTSIVGFVELLQEGAFGRLEPAQLSALGRVGHSSDRLLALVEDLLTVSRLDASALATRPQQPVDLVQVTRHAFEVVQPQWAARDLAVELEVPDQEVTVPGDQRMLERAITNLIQNAVKYTKDGGGVRVHLRRTAGSAVLEVIDTGIGIPREEQGQVFDRFFRSSLAEIEAVQGTGLGLSIVAEIVQVLGGAIAVDSEPGVGSTFTVTLPLMEQSKTS